MYARVLAESLMHYRECVLFLAINSKKFVSNYFISGQFNYCSLIGLTEKVTDYMGGYYVYVIMITPHAMTNF